MDDSFNAESITPSSSIAKASSHKRKSRDVIKSSEADQNKRIARSGIEYVVNRLKNSRHVIDEPRDDFHAFGMYVASELRMLNNRDYAKASQLKLNRLLLEIIENNLKS